MGIQINGTNDTISAADGSLEVGGFTFENKTTAQRNAGVSTAIGAVIYNSTDNVVQVYTGTKWDQLSNTFIASGGTLDTTSRSGYNVHTFTSPGTFTVSAGNKDIEYLVIAGGASGGGIYGGGGAGGYRTGTLPVSVSPGS